MSKGRKLTIGLALVGLAIAIACFVYGEFLDYSRPPNRLDFVVTLVGSMLCPPSLLSLLCIDCEAGTWMGVEMWSVIGLLNAALYGGIGLVIGRRMGSSVRVEK